MRSDIRWCFIGLEFTCWNGKVVRVVFTVDAHDREIIAWWAVTGGGIADDTVNGVVRDMMLEAVETRFGQLRPSHPVDWLSDNGSR